MRTLPMARGEGSPESKNNRENMSEVAPPLTKVHSMGAIIYFHSEEVVTFFPLPHRARIDAGKVLYGGNRFLYINQNIRTTQGDRVPNCGD